MSTPIKIVDLTFALPMLLDQLRFVLTRASERRARTKGVTLKSFEVRLKLGQIKHIGFMPWLELGDYVDTFQQDVNANVHILFCYMGKMNFKWLQ